MAFVPDYIGWALDSKPGAFCGLEANQKLQIAPANARPAASHVIALQH